MASFWNFRRTYYFISICHHYTLSTCKQLCKVANCQDFHPLVSKLLGQLGVSHLNIIIKPSKHFLRSMIGKTYEELEQKFRPNFFRILSEMCFCTRTALTKLDNVGCFWIKFINFWRQYFRLREKQLAPKPPDSNDFSIFLA